MRIIKALKEQLEKLGKVDDAISADYSNKPSALSTLASRRALYDALLLLKSNVVAARTKMRAEILEVDFKQKTEENKEKTPDDPGQIGSDPAGQGGA